MILLTGNKGFIGSRISYDLDAIGNDWCGYDIKDGNGNDIRDLRRLDEVFEKYQIDTVIHLAALAGVRRGEDYPQEYFDTNVIGTENILKMCKKYKVKKVIMFSSSSVYGKNGEGHPDSFYGISKLAMENLHERYPEIQQLFIVRPFTVYGENGRRDQVIFKWINNIKEGKPIFFYGDGDSYRTYTYVGDISDAVMKMLNSDLIGHCIFELGGKEKIKLFELLDIFKNHKATADLKIENLPMPVMDSEGRTPNMASAELLLGWEPQQDFTEKVNEILNEEFYE